VVGVLVKKKKFCSLVKNSNPNEIGGATRCSSLYNGTFFVEKMDGCSNTPVPPPVTKTPEPPATNPCLTVTQTLCDCVKISTCGWCEGTYTSNGLSKAYAFCRTREATTNSDNGEAVCKSYNSVWSVGNVDKCAVPNDPAKYYEATATGKVKGEVNATVSAVIESIIQKVVADKLGIDTNKVNVVVSLTKNNDGTTSFDVNVKVTKDGTVSETQFNTGVDGILGSSVEDQITKQGVDVQSGSVNINNNNIPSNGIRIVMTVLLFVASLLF